MEKSRPNNEIDVAEKVEGEGKGKQKDRSDLSSPSSPKPHPEPGSVSPTGSDSHTASGLSRFISSATGLSAGFMKGQGSAQFGTNVMAFSKAESSRANHGPDIALHETAQVTHGGFSRAHASLDTTFKSPATQGSGGRGDAAFSQFLGGAADPGNQSPFGGYGQNNAFKPVPDTVAATISDGAEVVNLLTTDALETDFDEEFHMTSEEISTLQAALFREGSLGRIVWDDTLDFVPGFVSDPTTVDDYRELAEHLGVADVAEARNIWLRQWEGVLSSYTPEVWGDLSPLVKAARQELQTFSTSQAGTQHGLDAVRRLRQILAHVRGVSG
ncbi:hypothetical protein F5Y17DRAFT_1952 [Xylariaceae sp. FL0594]|nr:hypothetical protein F5Y17DRAFT_1952 [Xylariaceae sp. FL0594]